MFIIGVERGWEDFIAPLMKRERSTLHVDCTSQGGRLGGPRPPPIFTTTKTSAFSSNAQSRFMSVFLDPVLEPDSALTVCSSGSNP